MDVFWLVPVLIALLIGVLALWAMVKREAGPGERTDGRVIMDKTSRTDERPSGGSA